MKSVLSEEDVAELRDDLFRSYGSFRVRAVESRVILKLEPLLTRVLLILEADDKVHSEMMDDILADIDPVTNELRNLLGVADYLDTGGVHPNVSKHA